MLPVPPCIPPGLAGVRSPPLAACTPTPAPHPRHTSTDQQILR
jgi:hypothetical protein